MHRVLGEILPCLDALAGGPQARAAAQVARAPQRLTAAGGPA